MAWLARDRDGTLMIYADKPERDNKGFWRIGGDALQDDSIILPMDADEKLIGKRLSWKNKPVEILGL